MPPRLSRDAQGSIALGADLARRVDRPNAMIKVPGTPDSVTAIGSCSPLTGGVHVADAGVRPQRPLWAIPSAKDPRLADTFYVTALARRTRSTRCPNRRCSPSPSTAGSRR